MFKTADKLVPEYLSEDFTNVNVIHSHDLWGAQNNLFIPKPNTETRQNNFS